jgi:hypothetical protein
MTAVFATYESALNEWRAAETRVAALEAFEKNGGSFRLRMSTDAGDVVIPALIDEEMGTRGYELVIRSALTSARKKAADAKTKLVEIAAADMFTPDADQSASIGRVLL